MALPDRKSQAAVATNRFGLGARPGDLAAAESDPRGWLIDQLSGAPPVALDGGDDLAAGSRSLAGFFQLRALRKAARADAGTDKTTDYDKNPEMETGVVESVVNYTRPIYLAEVGARTRTAITTSRPLAERLAWFWSNHFTVSGAKAMVTPVAGAFEREAIRPHVLGRFEDMLLASTRHPAMLLYLDNQTSFGPGSPRGRRTGKGLNENLAREVMELHTLGVDGGYSQQDVTTFAKALTGWTINAGRYKPDGAGEFWYVDRVHEPGPKTILGKTYPDDGEGQASAVLRDLARHPATARHVATKLARHFIADQPPQDAVDRLAAAFRDTDGDLRAVTEALVRLDAPWQQARSKVKTPNEFIVSSLRGMGIGTVEAPAVVGSLDTLGQRPFFAPSPAGWPDTADLWAGPDAIYKRIEWSVALGAKVAAIGDRPADLARSMLGPAADGRLAEGLGRAESGAQAVALLLSSPEFQRR